MSATLIITPIYGIYCKKQGFIQPPRRGGEFPLKQSYSPLEKDHQLPPSGEVPVLTTSWHVHCMLTFCYNTRQRTFIYKKIKY